MVEVSGPLGRWKQAVRRQALGRREAMGDAEHRESSRSIFGKVLDLRIYRRAGVVIAYAGSGSEVRTEPFLHSVLEGGKRLVLPKINRERGALDL
jgi:5-formyltetrahydrofolate cyclo-ligase